MIVYGGRELKHAFYFNDVFFLNLFTLEWIQVDVIGQPHPPRACHSSYVDKF